MPDKPILFLSTNAIWGGSEILWTQSAQRLIEEGRLVSAAASYDYSLINKYLPQEQNFFDLKKRMQPPGLLQRVLNKLKLGRYDATDALKQWILNQAPALVIISQGNNVDGLPYMRICNQLQIPFVTITHLVTESLWPALNDGMIDELILLYQKCRRNFFVSRHALTLNENMLGASFTNCEFIYNPLTKKVPSNFTFPQVLNGQYKVALIGRLENFHKGYDLLIEVLKQDKWKKRDIVFSIYGKGPHRQLLKRLIKVHDIPNLFVNEYRENIDEVWKDHHILLMPSRMEGQSVTLIEAMWFGRPAIVTQVGGVEELVIDGETGFVAPFSTPQHIDQALEDAWERRAFWKAMGARARQHISRVHPNDAVLYFNEQIMKLL
jgi:glycosyltransferase involved in cell wall biosynthesis